MKSSFKRVAVVLLFTDVGPAAGLCEPDPGGSGRRLGPSQSAAAEDGRSVFFIFIIQDILYFKIYSVQILTFQF